VDYNTAKLTLRFFRSNLAALVLPIVFCVPAAHAEISLMPLPASLQANSGSLPVTQQFRIAFDGYREKRLDDAATRMVRRLEKKTGLSIGPSAMAKTLAEATLVIHCGGAGKLVQSVTEDESYNLTVTSDRATLRAPNPLGILRGLETVLQLVDVTPGGFAIPAVTIEDHPRFPWRGMLIDVSRHFMTLDTIRRNLDGMAAVKMNVFHWHLSDDQGFRVESRVLPKLQQEGSDGKFYTQEQIRGIIEYARERGIRVVPEFDIPGHTSSWLVAYPELATDPKDLKIGRGFGILDDCMDPSNPVVYSALDKFIGEMAHLFPDEYFHIGGDEVNGKQWIASPKIKAFQDSHKMPVGNKDGNAAIHRYFNEKILDILKKHGKKMEGWDEILNPDLPKDIVIQSWRGQKSLAEAARGGFTGILSSGYYLDHMEKASTHYAVDPLSKDCADLTAEQKKSILGGESCMWGEYVTPENIDGRIWPRNAVIAERLWSPASLVDPASMYQRMERVSRELEYAGLLHRVNYQLMCERLAGDGPVAPVKTLADVAEAGSLGVRARAHKYSTEEPLNRLPDTVLPESDLARHFAALVSHVKDDPAAAAQVRRWLIEWRDNDAKLKPVIAQSALLAGSQPASETLMEVAKIGLEALDAIQAGKHLDQAWATRTNAKLTASARPVAEVRIGVVPAIQALASMAM
jgi:hexosaminidase